MNTNGYRKANYSDMTCLKDAHRDIYQNNPPQRKKVKHEVNGNGIKDLAKELEKLENVTEQDVMSWCQRFKGAMVTCEYDELASFKLLHLLISTEIKEEERQTQQSKN